MYTDRNALIEYAYKGTFYYDTDNKSDDGDLLSGGTQTEVIVLETDCDIQENTATFSSGTMSRGYNIYFPFDETTQTLPESFAPGIFFRGSMYGMKVQGTVVGIYPTQMHGCKVEIKGTDI